MFCQKCLLYKGYFWEGECRHLVAARNIASVCNMSHRAWPAQALFNNQLSPWASPDCHTQEAGLGLLLHRLLGVAKVGFFGHHFLGDSSWWLFLSWLSSNL
uniref:Family with sequence similarity 111, member A n=1 Tax=Pan troglodytes TaxID=9598 RepID=K7C2U3_PANTR